MHLRSLVTIGLLILIGIVVISLGALPVLYFSIFPYVPHYTSEVSARADVGATRITVPFCSADGRSCEGFPHFYRDGSLLLYQDREVLLAFDSDTGAQVWRTDGEFYSVGNYRSNFDLREFDNGAFAYASLSGQIVDLNDGRVVFQGCGPIVAAPLRTPNELYRVHCYGGVFLADFANARVAPYAAPDLGVDDSGRPRERTLLSSEPGWHGPIDQTDDGTLALWFLVGEQNAVVVRARADGAERWRAIVPNFPMDGRVDARRELVFVRAGGDDVALRLRDGRRVTDQRLVQPLDFDGLASGQQATDGVGFEHWWRGMEPGDWYDLSVAASEGQASVAHYQVLVPPRGLRFPGSSKDNNVEGGARRLIVTRQSDGAILFERPMEDGRTSSAGYDTGVAISENGRRVAVVATDGVMRVYELPVATN